MITITVNTKQHTFDTAQVTLDKVLESCGIAPRGIAVAVNNKVVRKAHWPATAVSDGDSVMVIQAVCGG